MSRERGSSERRSGSQFFQSILRPGTVAGALLLSVIVGTVLTFVYQGGQILAGHLTALMLTRLLLNYLVPYTAYSVFAAVLFHQRESAEDRPFVVMRSRPVGPAPELNVGPRDADAPSRQEAFQGGLSLDQPEASAWPPPANGALPLSHSRGGSRADEGLSPMPSIAELRVISGPSRGERYAIGAGGLIIGREEDSDVILDDPLVSRHHVRVRRQQEAYVVEDLGSRNGTLFNGDRLLRATPLLPGDRLTVGASEFQFNLRPPGISPALPEQRVQLSPRGTDEVMLVGPAPIVHERVGRLDLAGGNAAQPSYVLRKSVTTIGRGPDNDIVLRDNLASRHHARVMEYSGEYFLHDLDSVNGSRVNRERLDGPVRLRSGDEIVIGSVRLLFSLVDSG